MSKFAHADILDGGLLAIKNGVNRMLLISAYTLGDSYATVQGNKLAETTLTSSDMNITSSGNNRVLAVTSGKTATLAAAATGTDAHIAFTDGVSRVLWVTDETSNPTASISSTVTFPGPTYTSNQPT